MKKSKSTSLICKQCCKEFSIPTKEVTRQRKNGREHFFCSRSCSSLYGNSLPGRNHVPPAPQYGNAFAKTSNFGWYFHRMRARHKQEIDITPDYLEKLWEEQNGKCAITGLPINLQYWNTRKTPFSASLDRKDSSKGYLKGNVQFVAYSVNMAKNNFTDEQIKEFFDAVRQ